MVKNSVIVLVPIYKKELDYYELYSINHSINKLKNRNIVFIGPKGLDYRFYAHSFPKIPIVEFEKDFFLSIEDYNRLLLNSFFYTFFNEYEFILILQTDAIILTDNLDYWSSNVFDYIGAPFYKPYELIVNLGSFEGNYSKLARVHVGNGGLSLRRVRKCISLLKEFEIAVNIFSGNGSSEDLFFSVFGSLSVNFIIPNEITASLFAMEINPSYYYVVNGGNLPMGVHAWQKYDPEFWKKYIS